MKELIYLLACAVNGDVPDSRQLGKLDIPQLYKLAKRHTVRAAVCAALERAGIRDKDFIEAKHRALRKVLCFDTERKKLLAEFEQRGIWYMPLKGIILKDLYPKCGMREMADNDILYDKNYQKDVLKIMTAEGYKADAVGVSNHDVYMKPPVFNFELHTALFGDNVGEKIQSYYREPLRLMEKDDDNNFGYHLSDNDFYVFITAHEYKHFTISGTGIRSLLDCYVFLKAKADKLDFRYIEKQLEELGIADFEKKRRTLAMKVFEHGTVSGLDADEREMLKYYLGSGTYGNMENKVKNKLEKQYRKTGKRSKGTYIMRRVFPDLNTMTAACPFVKHNPLLYPVGFVVRIARGSTIKRRMLREEYRILDKYDDK